MGKFYINESPNPNETQENSMQTKPFLSLTGIEIRKWLNKKPIFAQGFEANCVKIKGKVTFEDLTILFTHFPFASRLWELDLSECRFSNKTPTKVKVESTETFKSLKKLKVRGTAIDTNSLQKLLITFPFLKELDISYCGFLYGELSSRVKLPYLETLIARGIIHSTTVNDLVKKAPKLKIHIDDSNSLESSEEQLLYLNDLKAPVDIKLATYPHPSSLKAILSHSDKVKTLDLSHCRLPKDFTQGEAINFATLETLDVSHSNISMNDLEAVLANAPHLRKLAISNCPYLYGDFAPNVNLSELETLEAHGVTHAVTIRDIIKKAPNATLEEIAIDDPTEEDAKANQDANSLVNSEGTTAQKNQMLLSVANLFSTLKNFLIDQFTKLSLGDNSSHPVMDTKTNSLTTEQTTTIWYDSNPDFQENPSPRINDRIENREAPSPTTPNSDPIVPLNAAKMSDNDLDQKNSLSPPSSSNGQADTRDTDLGNSTFYDRENAIEPEDSPETRKPKPRYSWRQPSWMNFSRSTNKKIKMANTPHLASGTVDGATDTHETSGTHTTWYVSPDDFHETPTSIPKVQEEIPINPSLVTEPAIIVQPSVEGTNHDADSDRENPLSQPSPSNCEEEAGNSGLRNSTFYEEEKDSIKSQDTPATKNAKWQLPTWINFILAPFGKINLSEGNTTANDLISSQNTDSQPAGDVPIDLQEIPNSATNPSIMDDRTVTMTESPVLSVERETNLDVSQTNQNSHQNSTTDVEDNSSASFDKKSLYANFLEIMNSGFTQLKRWGGQIYPFYYVPRHANNQPDADELPLLDNWENEEEEISLSGESDRLNSESISAIPQQQRGDSSTSAMPYGQTSSIPIPTGQPTSHQPETRDANQNMTAPTESGANLEMSQPDSLQNHDTPKAKLSHSRDSISQEHLSTYLSIKKLKKEARNTFNELEKRANSMLKIISQFNQVETTWLLNPAKSSDPKQNAIKLYLNMGRLLLGGKAILLQLRELQSNYQNQLDKLLALGDTKSSKITLLRTSLEKKIAIIETKIQHFASFEERLEGKKPMAQGEQPQGFLAIIKQFMEGIGTIEFLGFDATTVDYKVALKEQHLKETYEDYIKPVAEPVSVSFHDKKTPNYLVSQPFKEGHFREHTVSVTDAVDQTTKDGIIIEERPGKVNLPTNPEPAVKYTVARFPGRGEAGRAYAMHVASHLLLNGGIPTKDSPCHLKGTNRDELRYLYTALMILLQKTGHYNKKAVKIISTHYDPKTDKELPTLIKEFKTCASVKPYLRAHKETNKVSEEAKQLNHNFKRAGQKMTRKLGFFPTETKNNLDKNLNQVSKRANQTL